MTGLIDIREVLPQREPFIMVDSLTRFDMTSSTTETLIRADNLFVENGSLSPCGIMENMAQTCAARIGYYYLMVLHSGVRIGYIGAIRDFVISGRAEVGKTIETTVDVEEEIFGMTLAQATVRCGGEVIATAQIKLALDDN